MREGRTRIKAQKPVWRPAVKPAGPCGAQVDYSV